MNIGDILIGLLGLGFMVLIHELGHFWAARALGIEVEAFAIGWGPKLIGFKRGNTEYKIAWLPIGGYCKMKGEQDMAAAIANKSEYIDASEGSFYAAKPWKRIVVAFAGPFVNLVFAIIVLSILWGVGFSYKASGNTIQLRADYDDISPAISALPDPAVQAGLKSGDRVVAVDGQKIESFRDFRAAVATAATREIRLDIERPDEFGNVQRLAKILKPAMNSDGMGYIGVLETVEPVIANARGVMAEFQTGDRIVEVNGKPVKNIFDLYRAAAASTGPADILILRDGSQQHLKIRLEIDPTSKRIEDLSFASHTFVVPPTDIFTAIKLGTKETFDTLGQTIHAIGLLFKGLDPTKAFSGPGRIVYFLGEAAGTGFQTSVGEGFRNLFKVLALISVALFFGNLLPIPALDGGQILLFAYEAISRKRPKLSFITRYQIVGFVMVMALLGLAIYGDITFNYN